MIVTLKKIKTLQKDAGTGIGNLIDNTPVLEKIQEYGFTNDGLKETQTVQQSLEKLARETKARAGKKTAFYIRLAEKIERIHNFRKLYLYFLKRDLHGKHDLEKEFQVSPDNDYSTFGKLREAKRFFANCKDIAGLGEQVQKYGLTPEKLTAILAEIATLEEEEKQWAILKKDAQKATEERNKVFAELNAYWLKLKTTLLFVFRNDPQQLEAFNITAYSEGYKPKPKTKNVVEPEIQNPEDQTEIVPAAEDTQV